MNFGTLQVVRQSRASASNQERESSYRGILHLMLILTSKCSQSGALLNRSTMLGSWWRRKLGWDTEGFTIISLWRHLSFLCLFTDLDLFVLLSGTSHSCGWSTRPSWSTWRSRPTWSSRTSWTPWCSYGSVQPWTIQPGTSWTTVSAVSLVFLPSPVTQVSK